MHVNPFTPLSRRAMIRVSGMPHSPKPPTITVMPSRTTPNCFRSANALAALGKTLFAIQTPPVNIERHHIPHPKSLLDRTRARHQHIRPVHITLLPYKR